MYFSIGDATYHYNVVGEGKPVVLLHGFTGSSQTWSPVVSEWQSSFQCITIDLPGHGKSMIKTPRTMEGFSQDLKKLLDFLNVKQAHFVGYSLGGRTALSFAILYPKYVATLTLESSSPGLQTKAERTARIARDEKLARRIETDGVSNFVNFWENIPLFHTQNRLPTCMRKVIRKERLGQSRAGLAESLRFMGTGKQPSWWEALEYCTYPILLLVGEADRKFVKINEWMKKSLPNAEYKVVENAGHAIHVEQSEIFDKLVAVFIEKQSGVKGL